MPRSLPEVTAPTVVATGVFMVWGREAPEGPKARDLPVSRESVITPDGLEKLKDEIELLSTTKRREVAERIKEAREFGDIAENAEYDDAKNEQALLEQRIAQLEERLRRATVIDEKHLGTERSRSASTRPRQGPEVRRLAEVPDRRLDRGQPRRAQALERVADRQGADRPQARRRRHRRRPARAEEEAQDHQDRSYVGSAAGPSPNGCPPACATGVAGGSPFGGTRGRRHSLAS